MINIREMISIVRSDPNIGRRTFSYIDETQTDKELADLILEIVRETPRYKEVTYDYVLSKLIELENLWREHDAELFSYYNDKSSEEFPFKSIRVAKLLYGERCQCEHVSHVETNGCENRATTGLDTKYGYFRICDDCFRKGHMQT